MGVPERAGPDLPGHVRIPGSIEVKPDLAESGMSRKASGAGNEPVRVGIVGMGIRGTMYARICRALADVELVGTCDLAEGAREAAVAEFGVPGLAAGLRCPARWRRGW